MQVFYSVHKEKIYKPSKVAATKKAFSNEYVIDTTRFAEFFLFHVKPESPCFS